MSVAEIAERPRVVADPLAQLASIEKARDAIYDEIEQALRQSGMFDVNSVQGLLLARLGGHELSVTELISRGAYFGSNVSYNVRKLSEALYITLRTDAHDSRRKCVRLTPSGKVVAGVVTEAVAKSQHLVSVQGL